MKQLLGFSCSVRPWLSNITSLASNLLTYVKIIIFHLFKRNFPVYRAQCLGDAVSFPFPRRILNINNGIFFLDIT